MNRPRIGLYGIALGIAVVCVFAASLHGFSEHFRLTGMEKTTLDLFYLTGQLFAMNSGGVDGPVPWTLELARFLAPLIPASAVGIALWTVFSDGVRLWMLRFRRGHTIVCGLGRKGGRLVEELTRSGDRVVVIEPDEHNPGLARCRELKVIVLTGRADDQFNLHRAHALTARRLIATAGDDSINIETAVRAHALTQHRDRSLEPLQCIAHVTDPTLQQLLKSHHLFGDRSDPFDLELVNVYEAGARVMLERAGILGQPGPTRTSIRVCLVGLGHFGEAVLRRLLRDWAVGSTAPGSGGNRPTTLDIIIIDREANAKEVSVRQRFCEFLSGVTLHFVTRDVRAPDFAGAELAITRPGQHIDALFVCFDDDSLATIAALRIRERFGAGVPVVVRMTEETGFASLMESGGGGPLSGLRPIGFLDIACMRDLFLGGDTEIIARAFHEAYLEERLAAGDTPERNPAAVPWDRLAESDRNSNRDRARALRDQIHRAGLDLSPCLDRPIDLHRFAPEPLEILARIEHERWLAGKRAEGWQYGSERDNARKLNPFLVDWEKLPDPGKEFNRTTVRRLPTILARADFEVRELADSRR